MVKRYVKINLPEEAYNNFMIKFNNLNMDLKKISPKKRLPKTKFFVAISRKPIWFDYSEIYQLGRKRRGKEI